MLFQQHQLFSSDKLHNLYYRLLQETQLALSITDSQLFYFGHSFVADNKNYYFDVLANKTYEYSGYIVGGRVAFDNGALVNVVTGETIATWVSPLKEYEGVIPEEYSFRPDGGVGNIEQIMTNNVSEEFAKAINWALDQEDNVTPFDMEGYYDSYFADSLATLELADQTLASFFK